MPLGTVSAEITFITKIVHISVATGVTEETFLALFLSFTLCNR